MGEHDWLASQFEANRDRLRAVAFRMLGSMSEADDALQDAWLRASRADTAEVRNMAGRLTTIVARVCLTMLRSRAQRQEEPLDGAGPLLGPAPGATPSRRWRWPTRWGWRCWWCSRSPSRTVSSAASASSPSRIA